jgi:enoyl-CoA hydratase/carnithine racemase
MSASYGINLEHERGVCVVILNRQPLNVLDTIMQDRLAEIAEEIAENRDVRSVVLYGGQKTFAAGADIKEMAAMSPATLRGRPEGLQRGFNQIAALAKPVIAAVTGYAFGGGCELALCADLRYAAEDAVFGLPEVTLGIMPGCGGTQRLARLVGPARAKDMILTGRRVTASEGLNIGLVDRVVAPDQVLEHAMHWAASFEHGPSRALAAIKRSVDSGLDLPLDEALALERSIFADAFDSRDKSIGMAHFLDKKPGSAGFVGQ